MSSTYFVVSAIIVPDASDATVRQELAATRAALGRRPGDVVHFQKLTHSQRLKAVQDVAGFSMAAIANVIVHKTKLGQPMPAGNVAFISKPDPMYLWALRLLLERVSSYCDEHGSGEAIVTFAHVRHFKSAEAPRLSESTRVGLRRGDPLARVPEPPLPYRQTQSSGAPAIGHVFTHFRAVQHLGSRR